MIKICAISDLHGYLPDNLPACEVLCICGDIIPLEFQRNMLLCDKWMDTVFKSWAESLQCTVILIVPGNHDFFLERDLPCSYTLSKNGCKLEILKDREYIYKDLKFYGTPWCPELRNWAFYATSEQLKNYFSKIPSNVNILLTHCPPKIGNSGTVLQKETFNYKSDYGCQELAEAIDKVNPNYVFCGHVHSADHNKTEHNNTNIYNVSLKNEYYDVTYEPLIIEI